MALNVKAISIPWLIRYFWDEILTLFVCILLDLIEILFPILMIPVAGDVIDIIGISFSIFFFGPIGAISILELIPGLDMLPIFTATWLAWYVVKKRKTMKKLDKELESWR